MITCLLFTRAVEPGEVCLKPHGEAKWGAHGGMAAAFLQRAKSMLKDTVELMWDPLCAFHFSSLN